MSIHLINLPRMSSAKGEEQKVDVPPFISGLQRQKDTGTHFLLKHPNQLCLQLRTLSKARHGVPAQPEQDTAGHVHQVGVSAKGRRGRDSGGAAGTSPSLQPSQPRCGPARWGRRSQLPARVRTHQSRAERDAHSRERTVSVRLTMALAALLLGLALVARRAEGAGMGACYDGAGRPQRCLPEFENAAFGRRAEASHTCGSPPEDFCPHVGAPGAGAQCQRCDANHPALHHNASYLTDFHSQDESTWWQSPSMAFGVQYPTSVNITLRLGKHRYGPPQYGPPQCPRCSFHQGFKAEEEGCADWM